MTTCVVMCRVADLLVNEDLQCVVLGGVAEDVVGLKDLVEGELVRDETLDRQLAFA